MKQVLAIVLAAGLALPCPGADTPAKAPLDCFSEAIQNKNTAQFFVCLNVRREGCEEILRRLNSECGPDSAKYRMAFAHYTVVRSRANEFLDLMVADLRFGTGTKSATYRDLMKDLSTAVIDFEAVDQGYTCDGQKRKFLMVLLPLITVALTDKFTALLHDWLSGNKELKESKATMLVAQRWKQPSELGVAMPAKQAS